MTSRATAIPILFLAATAIAENASDSDAATPLSASMP
jgi:hypothetical protein